MSDYKICLECMAVYSTYSYKKRMCEKCGSIHFSEENEYGIIAKRFKYLGTEFGRPHCGVDYTIQMVEQILNELKHIKESDERMMIAIANSS